MMHNNLIVYNDGELELNVSIEQETVWLNRNQISLLFGRDVKTIGKHINNVFKDSELDKISTIANFATVQKEGGREVKRDVEYYNLDVIISVGYRVKSQRGVRFRQWATSILKQYIENGYAINTHKITEQRLLSLENDMATIKSYIKHNTLEVKQGIFFDGEIYDAYVFVSELIKSAKKSIVIVDNYIDDTVLTLLSKNSTVKITIYTKTITKQLKQDSEKYNTQYKNLTLKKFDLSHDRFLIIDDEIYHIGASLKDLGKKWFAFSKMDKSSVSIMEKLVWVV